MKKAAEKKKTKAAPGKAAAGKTASGKPAPAKKQNKPAPKPPARTAATKRPAARPAASPSALGTRTSGTHAAQLPEERQLTDEERDAMMKVAQTALVAIGARGRPGDIVASIAAFVDDIRLGHRPAPGSQDVRLGLGVLWGEQVRAQVGWRWVHLSYPNGFASYALVPDDRAFACFPLNRVSELLTLGRDGTNTSVALFESIRTSMLPSRSPNAYLVIG